MQGPVSASLWPRRAGKNNSGTDAQKRRVSTSLKRSFATSSVLFFGCRSYKEFVLGEIVSRAHARPGKPVCYVGGCHGI